MDASLTSVASREVHRKYPSQAVFFRLPVTAVRVSKPVTV